MPEDIAVLDAPLADIPAEPEISPAVDDNEGVDAPNETPDGLNEPESEQPEGEKGPEPELFDGNKLTDKTKAFLDKARAEDAQFAAKIRHALMAGEALKAVLPGGVKEAQQLRQTIEDLGGTEGIQEIQSERAEWTEIDRQYSTGDPRFIDTLVKESPDAFLQLAPAMIGKFAELNPDGHSAYVCSVLVSDMLVSRVPLIMERLEDFIPKDQPNAVAAFAKLNQYFARIEELSKKPVTTAKEKPAPDAREIEVNKREEGLIRNEWAGAANASRMSIFTGELARLTEGRKISGEQSAAIRELYASRLAANVKATHKDFNQKIDRYFGARDQKGYQRYMDSIYKAEIPKALKSAIDTILPRPAARKPVVNGNGAKPAQPKPADGYQFESKMPDLNTFDPRTTTEMIRSGRAVLMNGKKVQWSVS